MEKIKRPVTDAHVHIFPDKLAVRAADNVVQYYNLSRQGDGRVSDLMEANDYFEDVKFVVSSAALKPEHVKNGNNFMLEAAKQNPQFIPLASVHPNMGINEGIKELERVKKEGAKGIKFHSDFQAFPIDMEEAFPFYQACFDLELPVLFHVGDENSDFSSPRRMYNVINKLPGLTAVAAHLCGWQRWNEAEEILIGLPVYTDTSDAFLKLPPERIYDIIKKHGTDRVMFGSDYPITLTFTAYDEINSLPFNENERAMIFRENAERVYK